MPTLLNNESSGLGGSLCRLGEIELDYLKRRVAPSGRILSSGGSLWGLSSHLCQLGTLALSAWGSDGGSKRNKSIGNILSDFSKRMKSVNMISGGSGASADGRRWKFRSIQSISTTIEKRVRSIQSINEAKETLSSTYSPYKYSITTNEPHPDDGAPEFLIGNAKTGVYTDLSGIPYNFVLNMSESKPATWSLSIADEFGKYSPLRRDGVYKDLMDEKPFGPNGAFVNQPYNVGITYPTQVGMLAVSSDSPSAINQGGSSTTQVNEYVSKIQLDVVKELLVKAKIGGKQWVYRGIGTGFSSTRNWQTKIFNFAWRGNDFSVLLSKENQTMSTVRSNGKSTRMSLAVMQEIMQAYGVRSDFSAFAKDNFVIPFMNRNGTPIDWVTQILQSLLYEWKMVGGNTFIPYLPVPASNTYPLYYDMAGASPNFVHEFPKMAVMEESYEGSMHSLYNQVIATMASQVDGKKYSVDVFDFGDSYEISFDPPLSAVRPITEFANNGFFSHFRYYKNGTLLGVHNYTDGAINYGQNALNAGMIIGATSCKFTWGVLPGGFIGSGAPGRISFTGIEEPEPGTWGGSKLFEVAADQGPGNPAPGLRAYAENRYLISKYGLRPIEIPASSLIPNRAVLKIFAERMLFRLSRQARSATYKVPLNPWIEPGSIIREIDYSLGSLSSPLIRDRVVQSVEHSFSSNPENRYTQYTGNEYVTTV